MRIRYVIVNPKNRRRGLSEGSASRVTAGPDDKDVNAASISAGYSPLERGQPIHVSVELRSKTGDRLVWLELDRAAIEKMLIALVEVETLLGRPVTRAEVEVDRKPVRKHHDESLSHPGKPVSGREAGAS